MLVEQRPLMSGLSAHAVAVGGVGEAVGGSQDVVVDRGRAAGGDDGAGAESGELGGGGRRQERPVPDEQGGPERGQRRPEGQRIGNFSPLTKATTRVYSGSQSVCDTAAAVS